MGECIYSLYSNPTFIEGMAKILDFSGSLIKYNVSSTPEEADIRSMSSDLEAVGKDLLEAIIYEKEQEKKAKKRAKY